MSWAVQSWKLLMLPLGLTVFLTPDKKIFHYLLDCPCRDNRPPVKDPSPSRKGGGKLKETTISLTLRKMETHRNDRPDGEQVVMNERNVKRFLN